MSDVDGFSLAASALLGAAAIFLSSRVVLSWSAPPPVAQRLRSDPIQSPWRDPWQYSPSSPSDVFEVRRHLVNFLPPELVNTIIDEAGYWPRIVCSKDRRTVVVQASAHTNHNAAVRCLLTPPFPAAEELGGPGARLRVKLVKFEILSNDQGWGGEPEHRGTYNGSYTWFEAAILRPGKAPEQEPELPGWRLRVGWRRLPSIPPLVEVKNPLESDGRWRIQTNRCASRQAMNHTIIWQEGGSGDSEEGEREKGSGDGAGFIEILAPGDRIGVVARAMFPGWSNYVRNVELVVYYAV
ncbi:hypothetical protein FB451DRAFT_1552991 [Mycena latifolia]|nr:hypothetical protein FB451DRAFT_1552991 [Mycena latifolia]